jgi:hypothetical protein
MIHRSRPSRSFVPFPQAVRQIVDMDDATFAALQREVIKPPAFQLTRSRIESLLPILNIDDQTDIVSLFGGLELLHERVNTPDGEDPNPYETLKGLFKSTSLWPLLSENDEKGFKRVAALVINNEAAQRYQKRYWLETGILDTAVSFASFIDLRPNFAEDRSEVTELLPVIIFQIETDSDYEAEALVFQMTENGLDQMIKSIEDIKLKLERVKATASLRKLLVIRNEKMGE